MRNDYNIARNKEIYSDYLTTKVSFQELAKKYGISAQRVRYLINDYKSRNLAAKLSNNSSKEDREKYKNIAVDLREAKKTAAALAMLEEVIAWDIAHENIRGQMDALGHKKLALTHLADKASDTQTKRSYLLDASDCIKKAISLGESTPDVPQGSIAIQRVHYASILLDTALLEENSTEDSQARNKTQMLQAAKISVEQGIKDLPGSRAHKAWPALTYSRILSALYLWDAALDVLLEAQKNLYYGYEEELGNAAYRVTQAADKALVLIENDQAMLKLRVWSSGISLGLAELYAKQGKALLAEIHVGAVLATPDPQGILKSRKAQARKLLKSLVPAD